MSNGDYFEFGKVLVQTLKMPLTEVKFFLPLMLLIFIGPVFLSFSIFGGDFQAAFADVQNMNEDQVKRLFLLFALTTFTSIAAYVLFSIFVVKHSVNRISGENVTFGQTLKQSAFVLIPIVFLYIIMSFGIMVGTVLLIIPGIFLALAWYTAPAVLVAEGVGPIKALGRAFHLSKNIRLQTLGFILVLYAVTLVLSAVSAAIQALFFSVEELLTNTEGVNSADFILYYIVTLPITYYVNTIFAVGIATFYAEIRRVKEGIGGEALARTFD